MADIAPTTNTAATLDTMRMAVIMDMIVMGGTLGTTAHTNHGCDARPPLSGIHRLRCRLALRERFLLARLEAFRFFALFLRFRSARYCSIAVMSIFP